MGSVGVYLTVEVDRNIPFKGNQESPSFLHCHFQRGARQSWRRISF